MKRALITGVNGQDGSYLAEFLLSKNYEVFGMHRRSSVDSNLERIEHLNGSINLVCADMLDFCSLERIIQEVNPDEIYNLAAQSQVRHSFDQPHLTFEVNYFGVERLLGIVGEQAKKPKFYQASTSEMFGDAIKTPQDEKTNFNPVSPYGKSKLKAHESVVRAREDGLFACSGILFNHESPRRGIEFVTRKITDGICRIKLEIPQRITGKRYLEIGNLNAKRDWGFAGDYVEAMWMMLQQNDPEDYVVSSGKSHSVKEFVEAAATAAGVDVHWEGNGANEVGYDNKNNPIVKINPAFFRPSEIDFLEGDSSKARKIFGWKPKTDFNQLVSMMVAADYDRFKGKFIPSNN